MSPAQVLRITIWFFNTGAWHAVYPFGLGANIVSGRGALVRVVIARLRVARLRIEGAFGGRGYGGGQRRAHVRSFGKETFGDRIKAFGPGTTSRGGGHTAIDPADTGAAGIRVVTIKLRYTPLGTGYWQNRHTSTGVRRGE